MQTPRSLDTDPARCDRSLRWWSESALAALAAQVRLDLTPWCIDWGVTVRSVVARNACESDVQPHSRQVVTSGDSSLVRPTGVDGDPDFQHMLFGAAADPAASSAHIASACSAEAWRNFQSSLNALLGSEADSSQSLADPAFLAPWSGGVVACIEMACLERSIRWHAAVSADRMQRFHVQGDLGSKRPRHASKVAISEALQDQPQKIRACLDPVELSLGQLQSLQLDDLIVIPHAVDRPVNVMLSVHGASAPALCHAHLGTRNGHLAIELTSSHAFAAQDGR